MKRYLDVEDTTVSLDAVGCCVSAMGHVEADEAALQSLACMSP